MVNLSPFPRALSGSLLIGSLLAGAVPATGWAQTTPDGAPSAQSLSYFARQAQRSGLSEGDVARPAITNSYREASGVTHTYLRQQVNGVEVFGAVGAVHTDRNGKPVFANQNFVPRATQLAPAATPTLTAEQAVTAASVALGLPRPVGLTLVREARPADGLEFNNGGISEYNIPVRLFYFPDPLNRSTIHLAWNVTIAQLDQQHHWSVLVDAHTGRLLSRLDYVVSEATTFNQLNSRSRTQRTATASVQPQSTSTATRGVTGPNSLNVWAVPAEDPRNTARTSVPLSSGVNAWSPYGWQVSQAPTLSPPFFTNVYSRLAAGMQLTRGNNVAAYDDTPNTGNLYSNTNSPNGGATLDFNFPFDPSLDAKRNVNAGVVQLFYWNNMLHDVMASKGFDEASGNFQFKNFGPVGAGNDVVRAESQDGGGTNNANFSSPPDGTSGRMQMYLFDSPVRPTVTISAPASLAGTYQAGTANFGRSLGTTGTLCNTFVLVNDGVSGNGGIHGCASPYVNAAAVNGKIAVIMRGGCAQLTGPNRTNSSFADKVRRAQNNGAIAAIIFDSVATGTQISGMTGTDTVGIRIPSLFLRGVDGNAIRQALAAGTTVTGCATAGGPILDGSLDNTVVSHEFGHGISTRLTGGPANSGCLIPDNNAGTTYQTMGEGWADFFGLWMTTGNVATPSNPTGVTGSTPRYIGSYDMGGDGFRIKPYTDNMMLNNHTYGILSTPQYNETHNVGEVWAAPLWDLNWQFIYRYGFNPDFLATNGGNNVFLKLVLDGCKLQVCNPGMLDGRDAILRADSIANGGANSALIWTMFARRGMGFSALQGVRTPAGNPTLAVAEAFDMPPGVTPAPILTPTVVNIVTANKSQVASVKGSLVEAYPNPAHDRLVVRTQLASTTPVQIELRDALGRTAQTTTVAIAELQRGVELNTSRLAAGLYIVQVKTSNGTFAAKVQVQH